jgi:Domain of unknown function (DUF4440)
MLKSIPFLLVLVAGAVANEAGNDEAQVWKLEKAYWEYVKANDLERYRALWNENFLGWPYLSPAPVRKDHITDWITSNTSKGVKLQSYSIEQLAIQLTRDIAANHYRIKMTWSGPKPTDAKAETFRIHHIWLRSGDTWQILAGMSAPVNEKGQ